MTHRDAMREFERWLIWRALLSNKGNQRKTCVELDMHRNTLNRKMAELGINSQEARDAARIVAEEATA